MYLSADVVNGKMNERTNERMNEWIVILEVRSVHTTMRGDGSAKVGRWEVEVIGQGE